MLEYCVQTEPTCPDINGWIMLDPTCWDINGWIMLDPTCWPRFNRPSEIIKLSKYYIAKKHSTWIRNYHYFSQLTKQFKVKRGQ